MTSPQHLRDDQIRAFQPIVKRIAYHMVARLPACVDVADLIQVGLIGLHEAISRCKPSEGELENFAMPRIRGAMIDELRASEWASRTCRKSRREFDEAAQRLQNRLCRRPSDAELAHELGLSLEDYHAERAKLHRSRVLRLDDLYAPDSDEGEDGNDPFSDTGADPLNLLERQRLQLALSEAIRALPRREQDVMVMHYRHDMRFKDIGRALGVSESRVSQMHRHAVNMLRAQLRAH